ncbi:MAG: RluA family pseudouridine synthase [Clostridia bacterium]|jgi:23S rRNA pseudouridine1911/1915/1917 synthase
MQIIEIISDEENKRIDLFLTGKLQNYSRTYIKKLIDEQLVSVSDKPVKVNYKLKAGEKIVVRIPDAKILDIEPENIDISVMYEDDDIIVVNKAKGMVVHPAAGNYTGTLVNALMYHNKGSLSDINGIIRPGIVHRIDKDTSGVLVIAKNNKAHEKLSEIFKTHDIERVYMAVVDGIISEETGRIEAPIGRHTVDRKKMSVNVNHGRNATTHFRVIERFRDSTFIEVTLETGRTHQIRVHMAYINHPVIGDEVYGKKRKDLEFRGQALHAKLLGFKHPTTGEYVEFDSPLPEYFEKLLEYLRAIK